ncbi:MAG: AMIN domain-containing protein, partial [Myxococcota bacterium]
MRPHWAAAFVGALIVSSSVFADDPEIRSVEVRGEGNRAEVAIRGAFDVPTYAIRTRDEGRVLVVDVAGASLPEGGLTSTGDSALVRSTVGSSTARGVRLELHLSEAATYRARSREGRIFVRLDAVSSERREEPTAEREGPATLRDVTIERRDGRERVVLELDRAARFRVLRGEGPAQMEIRGARLSPELRRNLRGLPESLIRRVRVRYADGRATVQVERRSGAIGTAVRAGNRIVWMFEASEARSSRPRSRTIAREADYGSEAETADVAAFLS